MTLRPNRYQPAADADRNRPDWRRRLGTTFGARALAVGALFALAVLLQTIGS